MSDEPKKRLNLENIIGKNHRHWFKGLFGANSKQLSGLTNNLEFEPKIKKDRTIKIGARTLSEILSTLVTYGALNLLISPFIYPSAVTSKILFDTLYNYKQTEFRHTVYSNMRKAMKRLEPFYDEIDLVFQERHPGENPGTAIQAAFTIEQRLIGFEILAALSRPAIQATAATYAGTLPIEWIKWPLIATYLSIPFFIAWGINDIKKEDRLMNAEATNETMGLFGRKDLSENISNLARKLKKSVQGTKIYEQLYPLLTDWTFFGFAYNTGNDSLGGATFFRQLVSAPYSFRGLTRSYVQNVRDLARINTLVDILSGKPYMFFPESWDEYRLDKLKSFNPDEHSSQMLHPGLYAFNAHTIISDDYDKENSQGERKNLLDVSFSARAGYSGSTDNESITSSVVVISAPNGSGKSQFVSAGLSGIKPMNGQVIFKDHDGKIYPIEELDSVGLERKFVDIKKSHKFNPIRLCDVFQDEAFDMYVSKKENGVPLTHDEIQMLTMPDSMLEFQLFLMARDMKKDEPERDYHGYNHPEDRGLALHTYKSIFPHEMFETIYEFRIERNNLTVDHLKERSKSLIGARGDQPIGSLSQGMKESFMPILYEKMSGRDDVPEYSSGNGNGNGFKVYIFDEPLGSLDEEVCRESLMKIKQITDPSDPQSKNYDPNYKPPIVLLITHTRLELVDEILGDRTVYATFNEIQH